MFNVYVVFIKFSLYFVIIGGPVYYWHDEIFFMRNYLIVAYTVIFG